MRGAERKGTMLLKSLLFILVTSTWDIFILDCIFQETCCNMSSLHDAQLMLVLLEKIAFSKCPFGAGINLEVLHFHFFFLVQFELHLWVPVQLKIQSYENTALSRAQMMLPVLTNKQPPEGAASLLSLSIPRDSIYDETVIPVLDK